MSKEEEHDPIKERLDALKKTTSKPAKPAASPKADPVDMDQWIVLASRIEATGTDLLAAQQRGEEAHRKRLAELEHLFNGRHEKLIAGVRNAFNRAEQQQDNAFKQWGQRLTELESTNRLLAKIILAMGAFLMALLVWELLQ